MKAKQWSYEAQSFIDIETDDQCGIIPKKLDELAVCASCGKELPYGDCYTSLEYFDKSGMFGLCVCPKCHKSEVYRDLEYGDRKR